MITYFLVGYLGIHFFQLIIASRAHVPLYIQPCYCAHQQFFLLPFIALDTKRAKKQPKERKLGGILILYGIVSIHSCCTTQTGFLVRHRKNFWNANIPHNISCSKRLRSTNSHKVRSSYSKGKKKNHIKFRNRYLTFT